MTECRAKAANAEAHDVTRFAGPARSIRVTGAGPLAAALARVLPDWPRQPADGEDTGPADIRIEALERGLRVVEGRPPRAQTDYPGVRTAAEGLIGALIAAFVEQDDSLVCLHAAAIGIGRGLLVMLGDSGAGKSSLAAHLVQLGQRSFGDDRLVLRLAREGDDRGVCLALSHKLRLPLPADSAPGFASFVERHVGVRWPAVLQLAFDTAEAARFGEHAPLEALVLLRRVPGAAVGLRPAPASLLVRELVRHGFAPQLPAQGLLERMIELAARLPGFRLDYGRSADAAAGLVARFGSAAAGSPR